MACPELCARYGRLRSAVCTPIKFESYKVLEQPMMIRFHETQTEWEFHVYKKGEDQPVPTEPPDQPLKMPLHMLKRLQSEMMLSGGSIIDFGDMPDDLRYLFRQYIDVIVAFHMGDWDGRYESCPPELRGWLSTVGPGVRKSGAPPEEKTSALTVDVPGMEMAYPVYQWDVDYAVYLAFKNHNAFARPHLQVCIPVAEIDDECRQHAQDDLWHDYILQKLCVQTVDPDGSELYALRDAGRETLLDRFEPTSPSYSPTSPEWHKQGFDNLTMPQISMPKNWREAWTQSDVDMLFSRMAHLVECYNAIILDVHHGNVELAREPPRLGLGTYAKYLQPKNSVDAHIGTLLDKCEEAEEGHDEPPAKRSRSGSLNE